MLATVVSKDLNWSTGESKFTSTYFFAVASITNFNVKAEHAWDFVLNLSLLLIILFESKLTYVIR